MNGSSKLNNQLETWRIRVFLAVIAFVFGSFIVRLFILQILEQDSWVAKAHENSTEVFNLPASRGIIYDRSGTILARNVASYNIAVTAANLPEDPGAIQEIFRELSRMIDVPVNRSQLTPETPYVPCISDHGIAQIAEYGESATPFQAVRIKCDVDQRTAMIALSGEYLAWNFNSGMAAIDATLSNLLGYQDIVLSSRNVYGGTYQLLHDWYGKQSNLDVAVRWFDGFTVKAFRAALAGVQRDCAAPLEQGRNIYVFLESPCNPHGHVLDVPGICRAAHESGLTVICDSTVGTPILQPVLRRLDPMERPDFVIHSYTKDLAGAGTTTAGVCIGRNERMSSPRATPWRRQLRTARRAATGGTRACSGTGTT